MLIFMLSASVILAQEVKPTLDKDLALYTLEPVSMPDKAAAGIANPIADLDEDKWQLQVVNIDPIFHASSDDFLLDSVKAAAMIEKKKWNGTPALQEPHQKNLLAPFVDEEFIANVYNGWRPQDNDMAISNDGHIVSVVNSNISYYTSTGGVVLQSEDYSDFYDFLGLTGNYFDPRVLFDPVEEKFIMVILNGSSPSNTNVVVSFSISSNPNDGWWTYTFEGNAANANTWFDFPNIGISGEDLFISGNLFTSSNNYNQSVIYQMDKDAGFIGDNITWEFFSDVENGQGQNSGSVKPLSLGYDAGYGPGVYLVSSASAFGNQVHLYDIDGDVDDNQTISVFGISTTPYSAPANAFQGGSSKTLDTGDSRAQSGFYANGIAHFVFNTDAAGGFAGIRYNRIDVGDLTNSITNISQSGLDLAYGSCALFSNDVTDPSVLIGFERSGEDLFPEFAVVSVDENMSQSNKILVKEGQSPIDVSSNNNERWGDYTGISRRHSDPDAAVWVVGCYGRNDVYGNWIAEIKQDNSSVAPVANFEGTPTSGNVSLQVQFSDLSTNNPTSWFWEFEGGNPATSSEQNPSVLYSSPGTYNVTLTASNAAGSDVHVLNDYITANAIVFPPAANFSSNVTEGDPPLTVNFFNQSINNPDSYEWNFPGATPSSSTTTNPTGITYDTPGEYDVELTVTNTAGTDTEIKTAYIKVNDPNSTLEAELENSFQFGPNPTTDLFTMKFELAERTFIQILLMDETGKLVKVLFEDATKAGVNQLQFNKGMLAAGTYFLVIRDQQQNIIRNEKLVILN